MTCGFLAGIIEATLVHRPGLGFVAFSALAYSLLLGVAFAVLAALGRLVRRDLVPLGLGLATILLVGLEAGYYLNVRATGLEQSLSSRTGNLVVVAASICLGVLVYLLARRRPGLGSRLGFMRWVWLGTLVVLVGYLGVSARIGRPGPNCILISVDALRADHVGAYGYARDTSPNIDALARKSTIWLNAYTQSPGSTGGHAAMLTGLYSLSNGAYLNGYPLEPRVETIAEVFARNSYATGAFINNWYLSPALGFGQGFRCFVDGGKAEILKDAPPTIFVRGLVLYQVIHRALVPPGAHSNLDIIDSLRWIAWHKNHRFFLFLHIMDCHSPYIPPADLRGTFGEGGRANEPAFIQSLHDKSLKQRLTPEEQQILIDHYDEEILSADRKIGMLVGDLQRLGLMDRTMIVITADHGEVMGESCEKQFGHGTLDYACVRVPLLIHVPAAWPGRDDLAGRRIETVAQSIDIVPTIVNVLGLSDPVRRQGLSLVSPELLQPGLSRTAFTTGDIEVEDQYAAMTRAWLYRILGERVSLHSLSPEADHDANLIREFPAAAESLQTSIESWIERCMAEAVVPYALKGRSVAPGKEAIQRLKALGYIR
jgi:arylsulfatase A-like enzyme